MKKMILAIPALFVTLGTANSVLADECDMCLVPITAVSVGGEGFSGGYGTALFEGEEGVNHAFKEGGVATNLNISVASNGCEVDCSEMSVDFQANAWENVQTLSEAIGSVSGSPVSVVNENGAFSGANFNFSRYLPGQ